MKDILRDKIDQLPDQPGCYLFRNSQGKIIYVGKAANLRKRVRNYFLPATARRASPRQRSLLNSIADLDLVVCRNEAEALLTESRLIKDFRPRYNIIFRDDKRYMAIRADGRAHLPKLETCRIIRRDGAEYFGPFPSSGAVKTAIDFIEKRYGLRRCRPLRPGPANHRHCLDHIVRYCSAPCIGKISVLEYRHRFAEAVAFLQGRRPAVLRDLAESMRRAGAGRDFETAARLRDALLALKTLIKRRVQAVDLAPPERETAMAGLRELKEEFKLAGLPRVIEGFDISNTAGELAVASVVRAVDGLPARAFYRRLRIRLQGVIDDPRMIEEAVARRFSRLKEEGRQLPDLVLVDGGITQFLAARQALDRLGMQRLPVLGLAKTREQIFCRAAAPPVSLSPDSAALLILQRLRDEAHRFALDYHHHLRSRKFKESALDEIPGIGPAKKQRLLREFGSVYGIARADVEQISALPGINLCLAEAVARAVGGTRRFNKP